MDTTINAASEDAIQPKKHFTGTVVKTTLAGAVVDIGKNLPGIVHISQLQKEPVNRVGDVVQVGQEVDVWVRRASKNSIELTMIEPLAVEWREIKPEMVVKGKVARIESYGAFVDFGAERPGLVHVSEIAHSFIKNPNEVLHEGEEVEAKVLEIDRRKKQIRLSIKAIQPKPEEIPAKAKAKARKGRGRKGKGAKASQESVETKPAEPEPTSMEIAWHEALARAEGKNNKKGKRLKTAASEEQEDILSRTLEHRVPTG